MKKIPLIAFLLLLFVVALLLSGCDFFNKTPPKPAPPVDDSWQKIDSPTPTDVYKQLLAGVMNVATDFSTKSLESSPVLGADAKLKLTLKDSVLWLSLKGNYDNKNKKNAMFSLEISTVEDSYDDVIIGMYMCNQVMYVTLGSTKFKFEFPQERWNGVFPFNMTLDNANTINQVSGFLYLVLAVKDDKINGKSRLNGLVEEYNYNFSLDLAGTLKKVQNHLANNKGDAEFVGKINKIFANVLGLSVENIVAGNVPDSQLDIDFTNSNTKLSKFNCNIHIDQSGEYANTLFKGEDIDLDIELIKFTTSKSNVSIDFVNSITKQEEFRDYLEGDYFFKLALDIKKVTDLETLATKDYDMVISAKVFQEDSTKNFLLLEFYDKKTQDLEKALYAYNNEFYTFDTIDENLVCTTKAQLDLSELANSVYSNTFGTEKGEGSFNLFDTISYVLGVLKMDANGFLFNINSKMYKDVWFNYEKMLTYVNSLMIEDIFSEEYKFKEFESFISDYDTIINFVFENEFLSMMQDGDTIMTDAIERMINAQPLYTFTSNTPKPTA